MDLNVRTIIVLLAIGIAVLSVVGIGLYFLLPKRRHVDMQNLMGDRSRSAEVERTLGKNSGASMAAADAANFGDNGDLEQLTNKFRQSMKAPRLSIQERLFQAGLYTPADVADFRRFRIIAPLVATFVVGVPAALLASDPLIVILCFIIGGMLGAQLPFSWLDRRRKRQAEDILYYLPIVIEQVSVGVSSSLDVGPCLANIVNMADERDVHNPVTEIMRIALAYVRTGVSLQEALAEIGKRAGHVELKHAFMSLSQVAKHGGEVTKQLQELADSVSSQREAKVEEKIKKLELEATGPVALVFMGFILIFLVGFFIQIKKAFV
jgi:Flp pilus assembly protein TadB